MLLLLLLLVVHWLMLRLTLALTIGLPIYLYAAASLVAWINPPVVGADGAPAGRSLPIFVELMIYVALGLVWAWPLRRMTRGLGRR